MIDERQTEEAATEVNVEAPAEPPPKPPRGFGRLPLEQRREVARRGGKAVQARGSGHRFTTETGRMAGRKSASKGRPEGNA